MKLKSLTILLFLVCCYSSVLAIHIKGGWIYYEYLGKGIIDTSKSLYRVSLKVYRDCNVPPAGQNDDPLYLTIYQGNDSIPYSTLSIPLSRVDTMNKKYYSPCQSPHPTVCYDILVYSQTVELPKNSNGYVLSYQRCCRISGLTNVTAPSSNYGNTYSTTIPGTAIDPGFIKNNSPVFAQKDTVLLCRNSHFLLDYSAKDIDGDSLVYYYSNALDGGSLTTPIPSPSQTSAQFKSIPYSSGYTGSNPFGSNATVNKMTGIIEGNAPSIPGEWVLSVSVDEYRHGIKLGTTRKELHVMVGNCSVGSASLLPSYSACKGNAVGFQNQTSAVNIIAYHWDFGVINSTTDTSSLPTPNFTFPDTGNYKIKLVVNLYGGCSDSAFSMVTVYPDVAPKVKVVASGNPVFNDTKVIFVASANNTVGGASYTWYKNNIKVGIDSAVYVDSGMHNGDSIWCKYIINNPCNINDTIYSDTIKLVVQQGWYIAGKTINPKGFNVTYTTINFSGATNISLLTSGNYSYELNGGQNYLLRLFKNNDINKTNGVTTLDLALTQSHVLGKNKLNNPYKIIAADVNGDGKITTLDLVYMKRLILGIDTTFTNSTTKENRLWAFVDSSYQFPDTTNPFPFKDSISYIGLNANKTNQTFIGVKLGDVNWDWNPALARMASKSLPALPKKDITKSTREATLIRRD